MKNRITTLLCSFLLITPQFTTVKAQGLPVTSCKEEMNLGSAYSKAEKLNQTLQELVNNGVPGVAMAVYSGEGWWASAAGYAKIEDQVPMQSCHLQYLQSVSKTYMAAAILSLYEQGKIDLDVPITRFLPERYSRYVTDASSITVRMLLNHSSGIPEYNSDPNYVTLLLQHPDYIFTPADYLAYIEGKPLSFQPGSDFAYRNTNYVLLALIADVITGDHSQLINDTIFEPLELKGTYYRNDNRYLTYSRLTNTYWDRYGNSILENTSRLQRNNVASLIGDDGIVATPLDAVRFLKGLMEGELIADSTVNTMQKWVIDKNGEPRYGLGLDYTEINGYAGYGHSGGGIGAGCELYYFPEKDIYVFVGINLGTVTESPLHEDASKIREKLFDILLQ